MVGDIIMLYVGHTSNPGSLSEGNDRNACEIRSMLIRRSRPQEVRTRVDPTIYGNLVHKVNQACGYLENAYIKHPEIADSLLGSQTVYMSMLVASDTILPGTEICYYYGPELWLVEHLLDLHGQVPLCRPRVMDPARSRYHAFVWILDPF